MENQTESTAICFSASLMGFYPQAWIDDGTYEDTLPADIITLTKDELVYRDGMPPVGKILGSRDGRPVWVDIPPPTREQQIAAAEVEKQSRIDSSNAYMNGKQWAGKAAMGRLTAAEKTQYNAWLDYLDVLEAVDTSLAPDITWPVQPA